jgi:integrase
VLRSALDAAVRDQLLAHNPVAAVKRPGVPRREAAHLDAAGVTKFGGLVDPQELLRAVKRAAKAVGLEGVSPHTLRHSAATRWLEAGVHIKAVSDLLGHSSVAITGDTYGHTSDTAARSAVGGLAQSLGL